MKHVSRMILAALLAIGASTAHSAVIRYEGSITPPVTTVTGLVGGFGYIREVASDMDFWQFMGIAGNAVTIQATRLDPGLDPVLDLYFGVTTADDSLFRTGQSWGGLQFLVTSDDVVDPPAGPFGDPLVSFFRLPSSGSYTIAVGGGGSLGEGPYPYRLSLQVVPEPVTALLLIAGFAGLGWTRRARSVA